MINKKQKKEKGFLVLIAVLVSMILLSIGIFIATIAVREIALSSSVKDSQKAFFATDTITQCAILKGWSGNGFSNSKMTTHTQSDTLKCNGKYFDWSSSDNVTLYSNVDYVRHIYFASLSDNFTDSNGDGFIRESADGSDVEISDQSSVHYSEIKSSPYIKLIVYVIKNISDLDTDGNGKDDIPSVILKVYGHNIFDGKVIVERAMETKW